MKRNLIIFANPKKDSFTECLATVVEKTCESINMVTQTNDLYSMNFNPLLTEQEISDMSNNIYAPDVEEEHDKIRWANVLTFIYPIWWANMPAMMKGYIDRVIAKNFAYENNDGDIKGLLTNKKVIILSPMGNSACHYEANGMYNAMDKATEEAIFQFCGMKILLHNYYPSIHRISQAERRQYLRDLRRDLYRVL